MYHFHQLCDKHPDILTTDVWITIGFTYWQKKYCLIKHKYERALCLACTWTLESTINAFCWRCKASQPPDWTTGNNLLDSFIMESWSNMMTEYDAYIQWIEYSQLTSLRHGCTYTADLTMNELTRVTLKRIVDDQLFDFHQVCNR